MTLRVTSCHFLSLLDAFREIKFKPSTSQYRSLTRHIFKIIRLHFYMYHCLFHLKSWWPLERTLLNCRNYFNKILRNGIETLFFSIQDLDSIGIAPLKKDGQTLLTEEGKANALNDQFQSVFSPKPPHKFKVPCPEVIARFAWLWCQPTIPAQLAPKNSWHIPAWLSFRLNSLSCIHKWPAWAGQIKSQTFRRWHCLVPRNQLNYRKGARSYKQT